MLTALAGPFIAFVFFFVSAPFWVIAIFFMDSPGASDALWNGFMIEIAVLLVVAVVTSTILMIAARDRS